MTKYIEKERAIKLRKKGWAYTDIVKKVSVSKSTLSHWLAAVPYRQNKIVIARLSKARAISGMVKSQIKLHSIRRAQSEAKEEMGALSKRDIFMLGLGLYIGEGSKTGSLTRIINANPEVIKASICWFKQLGVPNENFSLAIHLYPDINIGEALVFWSQVSGIPQSQFGKTQVDRREGKKIGKRGKLPYGTAHLLVKSCGNPKFGVFFSRKIQAWSLETFSQINTVYKRV